MIKIIDIKKTYDNRTVLDISDFTFEKGIKYAIIGANGSGKSTLIKIISEVDKDYVGKLEFEKGVEIGYMPQRSFGFSMKVINNILLPIPIAKIKKTRERALLLLEKLGILNLKNKNASRLSGGETQRVALARVLMRDLEVLLLDEPIAAMDISSSKMAEDVLIEYVEKNNCTMIFATHSLNQAEKLSDKIMFFHNGQLDEFGDTKRVLSNPISHHLIEFLKNR